MNRKIFLFVLDGFGVGALPDAVKFGEDDALSNSFLNVEKIKPYNIPNLTKLGLKNIDGVCVNNAVKVEGCYGKLRELSNGKDTTTGHFEMMDIITTMPNPTFPNGFDNFVIGEVKKIFGVEDVLANCVASGTEIIKKFGEEHLKTGYPIIYTSADSVLQVACHTDIYPLSKQYEFCEKIRKIMVNEYAVGRIIARPFKTVDGEFKRINTARRDYSILPPRPNTLSRLVENGINTIGVGKIYDIFAGQDILKTFDNHTNEESLKVSVELSKSNESGLIFVNLVDTDMVYGHRNDVDGYRQAIEKVDIALGEIINNINDNDIVIITADHGCDPTTDSTDHSREYVPFLVYSKDMKKSKNLGTINGINVVGKFVENILIKNKTIDNALEEICEN